MTEPVLVALIGGVFLALNGLILLLSNRGKTKSDAKAALDARIDARVNEQLEGAWGKITQLEKSVGELTEKDRLKSGAFARILRAIAKQWPNEHGPDLDRADIALIEDTIPPSWIRGGYFKETP